MSQDRTDRDLLLIAAAAMGWDTTHPHNAARMQLARPCEALHVRRLVDGQLVTVNTAWHPINNTAEALELSAHFRLSTGFENRFKRFGECAYASYRSGWHRGIPCTDVKLVSVRESISPEVALCRAIVGAVVAQYEAGQC